MILASASPRRQELLHLITDDFRVVVSDADETVDSHIFPDEVPCCLAQRKAQAVSAQYEHELVIGADTVVILNGEILGKPRDEEDAMRMLTALSGAEHIVATGVAIAKDGKVLESFTCLTAVRFHTMRAEEIAFYVSTGEPMDKAGAYGIQGIGARYIESIEGDYYTVMGLPVSRLYHALQALAS